MSMNHHGSQFASDGPENDKHMSDLLKGFQEQSEGVRTRKFPEGRLSGDDDGELIYKIGSDTDKGIVIVDFGKPVTWLGLGAKDAITLAQSLIKHARAVAKEPITINIH